MNYLGYGCLGVVVLFVALGSSPSDENLHWRLSAPIPESRSDYAAGVIGGKLVIAGGTYWTGSKGNWIKKHFATSTHAFDPISGTWEKLPDLPVPLGCSAAAAIGDKLFVLGGFTGSEVNRKIFTLEKQHGEYRWKEFGETPFGRVYARAVSVGKLLYLVGGTEKFEPRDPTGTCCTSVTATRTLMALDTDYPQKGWQSLPPFPGEPRFYFGAETDGRDVWMFGGIYQALPGDPITTFNDVYRYDIAGGRWAQAKPLPEVSKEGNSPSPVFVGESFILMNDSRKVWKFDPAGETYRELTPLPEAASVDRFIWLNNEIIGASGENFIQGPRRRSEWVFIGRFDGK